MDEQKITTESGFTCKVSDEVADNYELLELLIELDEGNNTVLPKILPMVLSEEDIGAMKRFLRERDGRVATSAVGRMLIEIFKARKSTKNS